MFRFLITRIGQSILLMLGVLVLVFMMVRITGDPISLMAPRDATPEQRDQLRSAMGLDRPLPLQFTDYFTGILRGDLGRSLRLRQPNSRLIGQRLQPTVELALTAIVMAIVIAVPLGILGGVRPGSFIDGVARAVGLAGQTIPNFWLGMLLIIWFAVGLRWLPSSGRSGYNSLILPGFALGFAVMGQLVRVTRSAALEVRSSDYIRTAKAKGLRQNTISFRHLLPNIAVSLVSILGIQFTYLLGGSVYIEVIFAWPGLGTLLNNAVRDSDFPLIQAITIFISLFAIGIHLISDLLYGWIDPRIRYG